MLLLLVTPQLEPSVRASVCPTRISVVRAWRWINPQSASRSRSSSSWTSHSTYTCCTCLLIDLYASVRKVNEEISQFEGDFRVLEQPEATASSLAQVAPSHLTAALDSTGGSRLFHWMDELRASAVVLKAKNLHCHQGFWVGNHTAGCN